MTAASMDALVWTAPYEAELRREPLPSPAPGETVLAVRAVGVCGSDLHGYRGASPLRVPPLVLGHEVVGEDAEGTLHVVNPLAGCGACPRCAERLPNLCPERTLLGLNRPGAFAEHVAVATENLLPLPAGMSPVVGTLVEPLATSVNALRQAAVGPGDVVAIIGAGPIGLLGAYAAGRAGAALVACQDIDPGRVAHAARVADVADLDAERVGRAVADATGGLGAALAIDAVGLEATWNAAISLVRPGGTVAAVGLAQASGAMPVGDLVRRGITVHGVYAYTPDDFRAALELLRTQPPPLDWVETFALADGPRVLADLARGDGPVKAVFTP